VSQNLAKYKYIPAGDQSTTMQVLQQCGSLVIRRRTGIAVIVGHAAVCCAVFVAAVADIVPSVRGVHNGSVRAQHLVLFGSALRAPRGAAQSEV
jgi:hypothetical protein